MRNFVEQPGGNWKRLNNRRGGEKRGSAFADRCADRKTERRLLTQLVERARNMDERSNDHLVVSAQSSLDFCPVSGEVKPVNGCIRFSGDLGGDVTLVYKDGVIVGASARG